MGSETPTVPTQCLSCCSVLTDGLFLRPELLSAGSFLLPKDSASSRNNSAPCPSNQETASKCPYSWDPKPSVFFNCVQPCKAPARKLYFFVALKKMQSRHHLLWLQTTESQLQTDQNIFFLLNSFHRSGRFYVDFWGVGEWHAFPYPDLNSSWYNTDVPGKLCLLVQQFCDVYRNNQAFSHWI